MSKIEREVGVVIVALWALPKMTTTTTELLGRTTIVRRITRSQICDEDVKYISCHFGEVVYLSAPDDEETGVLAHYFYLSATNTLVEVEIIQTTEDLVPPLLRSPARPYRGTPSAKCTRSPIRTSPS